MSISNEELHQWVSGLFIHCVRERMYALRRDGGPVTLTSEQQEREFVRRMYEAAFDAVIDVFPEPLVTKLRAERATFVAMLTGQN